MPLHRECYRVIHRAAESCRHQMTDSTEDIVKQICTSFLWFDGKMNVDWCIDCVAAFRVLVRLLGISLSHDELPGSALPETADERLPTSERRQMRRASAQRRNLKKVAVGARPEVLAELGERVAEAQMKERRDRHERNTRRIRQVFDQLSNRSCK